MALIFTTLNDCLTLTLKPYKKNPNPNPNRNPIPKILTTHLEPDYPSHHHFGLEKLKENAML